MLLQSAHLVKAMVGVTADKESWRCKVVWESDDPEDEKQEYGLKPCHERGEWWKTGHRSC